MLMKQPQILAIHDISCFGRCSLTVALPIISATGIQTTVLPTAILSTHTGGFCDFTFRDLTDDLPQIMAHWQREGLVFDAVYTGYLGSLQQVAVVSELVDVCKSQGARIVVDPVMADHGKLYSTFSDAYPQAMRSLCQRADLILPNMTEALLLLDEGYQPPPYQREDLQQLLDRLSKLGPQQVVVTGVSCDREQIGAACYDRNRQQTSFVFAEEIPGRYHGTGDIYASCVVSAMMWGHSLETAMQIAGEFTVESIRSTNRAGTDLRYGVNFEAGLGWLAQRMRQQDAPPQES